MSSEMKERVARAITEAFDREGRVFDDGQAETLADAAIEAMREPTLAMCEAGQEATTSRNNPAQCEFLSRDEVAQVWFAMIDEALK